MKARRIALIAVLIGGACAMQANAQGTAPGATGTHHHSSSAQGDGDRQSQAVGHERVREGRPGEAMQGSTGAQGSQAGDTMRGSAGMARSEREVRDTPMSGREAQERWAMTHRASRIIGTDVRNPQGENLGDIKELVLDPRTGEISYAVVSFGGVLGLGDKLFAIPWKALKLDSANNAFVLNADKEKLRNAPGFDPDRWPDMASAQWNDDVQRFYGQRSNPHSGRTGAPPQREGRTVPPATSP